MTEQINQLKTAIQKGNFPCDFEHFGGAELIITDKPSRKGYPGDTLVFSEHASALSWLTIEIAKIYYKELTYMNKYAFYPTLGKCMNEKLQKHEDLKDCLLDIVDYAENELLQKVDPKKIGLTLEQLYEIMSYPNYWRPTLQAAAERGESIKETYEELKGLEIFM
ncbi:hypothetical protein V7S79_00320 [Aquirufa sp. ROCK-SH2]